MDFALIMFLALVVTGVIWLADRLFTAPARKRAAQALQAAGGLQEAVVTAQKEPLIVEYARAFFPVILVVFLLRSFLVEPFRIPSGSMLPGLLPGDFILVNKFAYGVRLPVINKKIFGSDVPGRGDVMVFRYPRDTSVNYIKRVMGLPGDHILYENKTLYINGKQVEQSGFREFTVYEPGGRQIRFQRGEEKLDGGTHDILITGRPGEQYIEPGFPGQHYENVVPEGHYFVMGDNRDRSNDSRYWGFVPDGNLVGRAFLIWFSLGGQEGWFWERVLWNRVGSPIN